MNTFAELLPPVPLVTAGSMCSGYGWHDVIQPCPACTPTPANNEEVPW